PIFLLCMYCVFFFSSRRRHTRFSRDWSSDVCSSDLDFTFADECANAVTLRATPTGTNFNYVWTRSGAAPFAGGPQISTGSTGTRSEERRVGKECRSRWSRMHEKKNQDGEQAAD